MNHPCIMPSPFYTILLSVTDKALQLLVLLNRIFPQSLYSIYNHYDNFKMPCCNSSIVGTTKWKPAYRLYKATRLSYILQIDFFFLLPLLQLQQWGEAESLDTRTSNKHIVPNSNDRRTGEVAKVKEKLKFLDENLVKGTLYTRNPTWTTPDK